MKTKFLYALGAILLGVALFPFSASSAEPAPITVQKRGDGSSIMLGAGVQAPLLVIGTSPTGAGTLRIAAGGTLDIQAGAIVNFPTGFIPWVAVNKAGSSLLDLATRSAADLSTGTLLVARLPAFAGGDASSSAGSAVLTLATVATGATTGSSTAIPIITFNNKGLVTAVTTAAVIAPAGTLTGTTLAANVVTSSLTTVGTIGTGTWQGSIVAGQYGGTGINNSGKTITLGGNLATSGAFASTFTMTGITAVTFPTSGTLATTAGTVASVQGTAGQILANGLSTPAQTGVVVLTLPTAITGINSITFASGSSLLDTSNTIIDVKRQGGAAAGGFAFWDATNTAIARVIGSGGNLLVTNGNGGTTYATFASGSLTLGSGLALSVPNTTASSSTTTGSGTFGGGLGVAGRGTFGSLSAPGSGSQTERFGNAAATNDATRSLAVGDSASVATGGSYGVALGYGAATSSDAAIAIGGNASATNGRNVAIGYNSSANTNYGVAVGYGAVSAGGTGVRVGANGSAANNSIAIGYGITATTGQIILGWGNSDADVWLGAGPAAGAAYYSRINGVGGASTGINGGILYLSGGKGGVAADTGGSVRIQTAASGAGQTLVDRLIVAANGDISHTSTTASSSTVTGGATFAGGIGVAGAIWGGSTVDVASTVTTALAGTGGTAFRATGSGYASFLNGFTQANAGNSDVMAIGQSGAAYAGALLSVGNSQSFLYFPNKVVFARGTAATAAFTFDGSVLNVLPTTASTTSTTGAITTAGGLGAAGSVNSGGYVTAFGGSGLSSVASDFARLQAASNAPSAQFVRASNTANKRVFEWIFNVDGTMTGRFVNDAYSVATNAIQINGDGATSTSGTVNFPGTTASTSTTTGSGIFSGGVGIAGRVNIGDRTAITDLTSGNPVLDLLGLVNGGSNLRLANSSTDNTLKSAKIGTRAYVNAQTGLFIIGGDADTASNTVYIGGGTSTHQAATEVDFYTASAVNTATGTRAGRVLSTGVLAWDFGATFGGKITNYNAIATAGNGVASIQAAGRATAQTAANASVASYTVGAADASFIVSANVLVTTSTTHNFTVTCAYTDEGNTARTATFNFTNVAGTIATAIANAGGAVPYQGVPIHIRAKASTAITIATTGTFTSVTYNAEGVVTKLQ